MFKMSYPPNIDSNQQAAVFKSNLIVYVSRHLGYHWCNWTHLWHQKYCLVTQMTNFWDTATVFNCMKTSILHTNGISLLSNSYSLNDIFIFLKYLTLVTRKARKDQHMKLDMINTYCHFIISSVITHKCYLIIGQASNMRANCHQAHAPLWYIFISNIILRVNTSGVKIDFK